MKRRRIGWMLLCLASCGSDPSLLSSRVAVEVPVAATPAKLAAEPTAPAAAAEQEPTSQPSDDAGYGASTPIRQDDGSALYGQPFVDGVVEVTLAELLSAPEKYADTAVRTTGEISRICQNMGCWMELKDGVSGQALRAPLAGHSYFLPQSALGKQARVEGKISVRPLSDAQKAHLEAEGASATGASVSIIASGVAVK